jgi:hypothetical protein
MRSLDALGVDQFLKDYPGMSLGPSRGCEVVLKGRFSFEAQPENGKAITDSFDLGVTVPHGFPCEIPSVRETGGRIPRDGRYHINPDDTFCLGSPIRLLGKISERPTVVGFVETCLVPYLYAVSHKLQYGGDFMFSELAHGTQGIIDDYMGLFGLRTRLQVLHALRLLGMKRRMANKKPCPCDCGRRLGKCSVNLKIIRYRRMAPVSWFRSHMLDLGADS